MSFFIGYSLGLMRIHVRLMRLQERKQSDARLDSRIMQQAFACAVPEGPPRQSKVRLTPFSPCGENIRPLPCSSSPPQKANGFSGTPEVLMEKVRISKHLLHQQKENTIRCSLFIFLRSWMRFFINVSEFILNQSCVNLCR